MGSAARVPFCVDGRRINSCLTLPIMQDGAEITTIEGLGRRARICTLCRRRLSSTTLFSAAIARRDKFVRLWALISEGTGKTAADIRELMSGNICRCGAYPNIVAAIEAGHGRERPKEANGR